MIKLHTTREERDSYRFAGHMHGFFERMRADVDLLEDELSGISGELESALRERDRVRSTLIKKQRHLEEVTQERDKLRDELFGVSEQLESARQTIEHKNLLLKSITQALREYQARLGIHE